MASYSVADARNNLSKLIERAERGETVEITRHGKAVVKFVAVGEASDSPNWKAEMLKLMEDPIPLKNSGFDGAKLIREMRDEGY